MSSEVRTMAKKYNVDELKYIESLKFNKKAVVYYDNESGKYIDINSNTDIYYNNIRAYKKNEVNIICDFNKVLFYNSLWVLLLDSYGQKRNQITAELINDIIRIFEKINGFCEPLEREVYYIANLVAEICISNLSLSYTKETDNDFDYVVNGLEINIPDEQELQLRSILFNYMYIDIAINGLTERKLVITKENNLIDYKILRILKHLGININIEDIPNFKIEYNLEGITYYDSKGNTTVEDNLSNEEVEKIKKLVDKKTI